MFNLPHNSTKPVYFSFDLRQFFYKVTALQYPRYSATMNKHSEGNSSARMFDFACISTCLQFYLCIRATVLIDYKLIVNIFKLLPKFYLFYFLDLWRNKLFKSPLLLPVSPSFNFSLSKPECEVLKMRTQHTQCSHNTKLIFNNPINFHYFALLLFYCLFLVYTLHHTPYKHKLKIKKKNKRSPVFNFNK